MQASKVGAAISADIKTNSFWAVLGAMLVVGLYLVISFRKWQYSLGAIAAILHDVIFVLGIIFIVIQSDAFPHGNGSALYCSYFNSNWIFYE